MLKHSPKIFFKLFLAISGHNKWGKIKIAILATFFSSACIFGRIYKYTQVFQKNILVMWDKNWAWQMGSLGGGKLCFPSPSHFFLTPISFVFAKQKLKAKLTLRIIVWPVFEGIFIEFEKKKYWNILYSIFVE
jgi:hypothetical protein